MVKKFFLLIFIIFFGTFFTNFLKNKTKDLDQKIILKKDDIFELKKNNESEIKENIFLKNPERIKLLAEKYLGEDYIFYNKSNIKEFRISENK